MLKTKQNNPNYWRAAFTAAPESRIEGGKEQIEMLWCHINDLYTDVDYSFSWALISEPFSIIFILSGSFWLKLIWLCHSWCNFDNAVALCSGIILCSHLFTCFFTGSTYFRSTGCVEVTSAFRNFRSLSSFKMAAPTGQYKF